MATSPNAARSRMAQRAPAAETLARKRPGAARAVLKNEKDRLGGRRPHTSIGTSRPNLEPVRISWRVAAQQRLKADSNPRRAIGVNPSLGRFTAGDVPAAKP